METDCSVRVETIASPDRVERGFEDLLAVERASWKHVHGTAISAVPRQIGFYRDLCRGAASSGHLHLHFLYCGDDPVAYDLGYVRDGIYSYLKTSYVDTHRSSGAATYLRARLVRELIEDEIRVLDFPAEPYEWERQWTTTVRWHKVLTLYRATPAGIALALADRVLHRSPARTTRGPSQSARSEAEVIRPGPRTPASRCGLSLSRLP